MPSFNQINLFHAIFYWYLYVILDITYESGL